MDNGQGELVSVDKAGHPGWLLLWPGDVVHDVPPHKGGLPRISIAFNLVVSHEKRL